MNKETVNHGELAVGPDALRLTSHATISAETRQSVTALSSYISSCLLPFRRQCSMALTLRGEMLAALIWKLYRMKRRNLGLV